ncbi:MAG: anthranilate synthase component I [Clostridium sp.]|nr:anthranilate synthase component I [Clostridium sp.]MCM1397857.1 anthranilate synthase component I [Clostridium sp.]MCM1459097.1 anthranilate synthase component I [Bacteroides sp.]
MIRPTLETAKELAGDYRVIPVCKEIYSDFITPIQVLRKLKKVSGHCYMLESVENQERWGRYTFLGYQPKLCITCINGLLKITDIEGNIVSEEKTMHPQDRINQLLAEYKSPRIDGMPSFTGGLVGYFAYDYIKYGEPRLNQEVTDTEGFNDVDLMLFDKVIAFDNVKQKLIVIANAQAVDIENGYQDALDAIDEIIRLIRFGEEEKTETASLKSRFRRLFDKEEFCSMVNKAKHYIYEGDIFQVVLSNRLEADFEGSLLDTYRVLRTINPSPYMFYFSGDDIEVAGASPETLVKLENGVLHTFPLAGTRPRGKTVEEDKALEAELLADEKECAEHNMLVDLGRNDLGRISKFGSVNVEKYMSIERYSHVMHIGSTVRGEIREDKCALDAVCSVLPAGTLSGAPKIRACEIIRELENNKRGIYGGAIGYIDFTGNLDTCIAIRIAYKKNGKVFVRSGAGIVADSVPENEFQECINKAQAVVTAIETSQSELNDM